MLGASGGLGYLPGLLKKKEKARREKAINAARPRILAMSQKEEISY